MGGTRVLVGTRKGAFVLTSDEGRTPLPDRVVSGEEPFMVMGAMAGG